MTWAMNTLQEENGVILYEVTPDHGESWFGVADETVSHFRVSFCPCPDDRVSIGVDAAWSDAKAGVLANYSYEFAPRCRRDDVLTISDDGLLTAMVKARAASTVDFRQGFTVQLPKTFVPFIRKAIELAFTKVVQTSKEQAA